MTDSMPPPPPLQTPQRRWTLGWLGIAVGFVGATIVNVGALVIAVATYWDLGGLPSTIALMLLATTFVTGVVVTDRATTKRQIGVGLTLGAVVTTVLLLGWLALSIHALNANGVA